MGLWEQFNFRFIFQPFPDLNPMTQLTGLHARLWGPVVQDYMEPKVFFYIFLYFCNLENNIKLQKLNQKRGKLSTDEKKTTVQEKENFKSSWNKRRRKMTLQGHICTDQDQPDHTDRSAVAQGAIFLSTWKERKKTESKVKASVSWKIANCGLQDV